MKEFIEFYVYTLYRDTEEGTEVAAKVVLNDCSDNLCIGATGVDDKYYQYDSYEGYHSHGWFEEKYEQHGLRVVSKKVKVSLDNLMECQ